MKTLLSLSPALRTSVAAIVSLLPKHFSLAVGVDQEGPSPYFMDLRVSSSGLTQARERITFETEEQVREALLALYRQLGLTPPAKAEPTKGFTDIAAQLPGLRTTSSITG